MSFRDFKVTEIYKVFSKNYENWNPIFLIFLQAFCSELILWRVDPVGPLSKSGGITELARINSQEISAFSDVAWIPTLLPSSTLGSITNSPSACFVGKSSAVCSFVFAFRSFVVQIFWEKTWKLRQIKLGDLKKYIWNSQILKSKKFTFLYTKLYLHNIYKSVIRQSGAKIKSFRTLLQRFFQRYYFIDVIFVKRNHPIETTDLLIS